MKKILIVYYSKTGNTKKVAEKISKILKADIDEIVAEGKHMPFQQKFKISYKKNPSDYDLVIVSTPVWAFNITPAVKKYLIENKNKIKKIAFFCTHSGMPRHVLFKMGKLSKEPIAVLDIKFNKFKQKVDSSYETKIKDFCEKIK